MDWLKNNYQWLIIGALAAFIFVRGDILDRRYNKLSEELSMATERRYDDSIYIVDLNHDLFVCDSLMQASNPEILREIKSNRNEISRLTRKLREQGPTEIVIPEDIDSQFVLFLKLIGRYE